jgi:hypothetical protein
MTFGSDTRKSKHGLNSMEVGEVRVFDTPTIHSRSLIRRAAHNRNERTEMFYVTRSDGDTIRVTRIR